MMAVKKSLKSFARISICTFFFLLFFASGITAAKRSYSATGLVLKVDLAHNSMVVSCKAIPDFMDAMTMPFEVRDSRELKGVAPGAVIDFDLVVDNDTSYAANVRIKSFESLEQDPMVAHRLTLLDQISDPSNPDLKMLAPGQRVPDFSLLDQNRQGIALSHLGGKVVLITFIYTRCPLPNFCFRLSNNFSQLQKRFASRMGTDLVLLSITFDPEHDQPEVLAHYADIWKANSAGWHMLTGPSPQIQQICHEFGMNFWPDEGAMTHSLHTAIIDQRRNLVANLEGNEITAQQLGDLTQTVMDRH